MASQPGQLESASRKYTDDLRPQRVSPSEIVLSRAVPALVITSKAYVLMMWLWLYPATISVGNGSQYAVIKHIMINGDMWVRCLRCAKTWLPPVKDNFYFNAKGKVVAVKDGVFSSERFEQAQREYLKAMQFETNNSPSASVVCKFTKWDEKSEQWVDATTDYRIAVKNSNLR